MLFKFLVQKIEDSYIISRYQVEGEDEWTEVDQEFQGIENHPAISSSAVFQTASRTMTNYRTLTISLSETEGELYLDKTLLRPGATDSTPPTDSSHDPKSDVLAQMVQLQKLYMDQQAETLKIMNSFRHTIEKMSLNPSRDTINIEKYDGKSEEARIWIISYEHACASHKWVTDEQKIRNLRNYLEGIAVKWYNSRVLDRIGDNWEEWKNSFLSAFGQNRIQLSISADMWEYRGGSLLEYYFQNNGVSNLHIRILGNKALSPW
ncbi:uncharacterized protein LOC111619765 [Centruroides sculpturatus]|uniref:uncharacterized protein LOC111619765 n=1 Tax=Centruroides sculpturatus TaxID=218467 RepID=UPI000C6C9BB6|nr:uncharacterized protein LOC111619765 [Centruroides sculpturatus]